MGLFNHGKKQTPAVGAPPRYTEPISADVLNRIFADCCDFDQRQVALGGDPNKTVTLCFFDGLVAGMYLADQVIRPMTDALRFADVANEKQVVRLLMGGGAYAATVRLRETLDQVVDDLLGGFCAVILNQEHKAVTFEMRAIDKRAVDEPKEEKVVKGAKDSFIELLRINTMLLRRRMRNPDLKIRALSVGSKTNTQVAMVWLEGFTNPEITAEVERRLRAIRADGALTAAVIEEHLSDAPRSPFPQLLLTERPDRFCMNLLEGRVGILVDGLPLGYLAPGTFAQFFKVPEDAANHRIAASALTILRYFALLLTLVVPAFYVAVAMYHQEMIPTRLLTSMITAKQSVPFPTAVEVVGMLLAFELLQEAGLRLPNPVGQTVSIIGALIVGEAAVAAKVVSPVVVVVIAIAGIAGYTMPNQDMSAALRIWRFILVLAAIAAGLYGLVLGCAVLVYRLCAMESFGVAYMTPFADRSGREMLRGITRWNAAGIRLREPALKTKERGE